MIILNKIILFTLVINLVSCNLYNETNDISVTAKNLQLTNSTKLLAYFKNAQPSFIVPKEMQLDELESNKDVITSSTNLQELGVDESDLIKFDGKYIYSLKNNQYDSKSTISITNTIDTSNGTLESINNKIIIDQPIKGIYLDKNQQQLIAVGGNNYILSHWFKSYYFANSKNSVLFYNIQDKNNITESHKYDFEGKIINSKRNGDTLYLVIRYYPNVYRNAKDQVSLPNDINQYLPYYKLNNSSKKLLVSAKDCYLDKNTQPNGDVITMVAIDLKNPNNINTLCFIGKTEAVYTSTKALYLATTKRPYPVISGVPFYGKSKITTEIHKFNYQGINFDYRGSGSVVGHLGYDQDKKSFRLSENNNYLRVVTTARANWLDFSPRFTSNANSNNQSSIKEEQNNSPVILSILQESINDKDNNILQTIATLPNSNNPAVIGKPGEKLYASRFIGDKAYLITFRVTDPLYILDLSDPYQPKIAGELEINGYSDYLHPLGNDLLLGVGKDAVPDTLNNSAWYQGVKLSLFDISNPSSPIEVSTKIIGKRGSSSAVSSSHHGISIINKNGTYRVSLPISVHDTEAEFHTENPANFYDFTYSGLFSFEINTQSKSINLKSTIINEETSSENNFDHESVNNDRSIIQNDTIYYLHQNKIVKKDW